MSVVRLAGSAFYWMHHPGTATNADHYTLHAQASGQGKLPTGFYCMCKRLGDRKWFWKIAHLYGYTSELKGTCTDRTRAMSDAETATRKIIEAAPVPGVATKSEKGEHQVEQQGVKSKSNGVG